MKKNTLFLSAGLTMFTLVLLAGVLKAGVNGCGTQAQVVIPTNIPTLQAANTATNTATIQPTDTAMMLPTDTATMLLTASSVITPQDAAFIAGSALGNTKIYSVDTVTRYGMDVYKVSFSSGTIVYVSPQGHILTITSLQTTAPQPTSGQQNSTANSPAPSSPSSPSGDDGGHSGGDD